ncbi:hypothetical protein BDZ91DRAFT_155009 [Kalaharituber pfeilii]|nr:hypothetical protein BDZ91DRAFT_155009 [Kalaharituber pfeilii]
MPGSPRLMDAPPQTIRVKRRHDEDPVPALIVETSQHSSGTATPTSTSSARSSKKIKLPGDRYVFRLTRTEGTGKQEAEKEKVKEKEKGKGKMEVAPPIVRSSLAGTGTATPTKRKGPPESPLLPVATRERKEEVRARVSRESLREMEKGKEKEHGAQVSAGPVSTRKRPKVHPLEKKEMEEMGV